MVLLGMLAKKAGGALLKKGASAVGKALGVKGKKKSRKMSVDKKIKKLINAKLDGKIMKAKYGNLLK